MQARKPVTKITMPRDELDALIQRIKRRNILIARLETTFAIVAGLTAGWLAEDPILRFFHYSHLPEKLKTASKPFCDLAGYLVETLPRNAERTTALRKLLEAKDCAVRANLGN